MISVLRRASTRRTQMRPIWDSPLLTKVKKNASFNEEHEMPRRKFMKNSSNQFTLNTIGSVGNQTPIIEASEPNSENSDSDSVFLVGTRVWSLLCRSWINGENL